MNQGTPYLSKIRRWDATSRRLSDRALGLCSRCRGTWVLEHGPRRPDAGGGRPDAAGRCRPEGRHPALDQRARRRHRPRHRRRVHLPHHPRPLRRPGARGRVHDPWAVPPVPHPLRGEALPGVHVHLLGTALGTPVRSARQARAEDHVGSEQLCKLRVGEVVELGPVMGREFAIQHINPPEAAETMLLFAAGAGIRSMHSEFSCLAQLGTCGGQNRMP